MFQYAFKRSEEEDDPLDQTGEDDSKDNYSASNQSERIDFIPQEGFGEHEHEFDADQDETSLLDDESLMQRKNRSRGQRSPVASGQEGREESSSQEDDQDQPKTRKRSMRASGRGEIF